MTRPRLPYSWGPCRVLEAWNIDVVINQIHRIPATDLVKVIHAHDNPRLALGSTQGRQQQ